ncbi:GDA1/CD39 nucleoside phosphatase family protein [Actinidia rufa]|uniref:GDA1/CD39 nucleoside phosphatase family protein n=1 Tax=Actinidia rufa TaxID=165716 RepID=A0A7J0GU80_9ERIC|nr:GDA1/CD39 nucleoside phosphatase family protein [Actinidia rufa]
MRRSNARTLGRKMDSIKLHFRQNSPRRSNLFSRNLKNAINTTKSNILIFALITVTLALFCYVFVPSTVYRNPAKRKFRIVIDGGSTGTRIHVFEYVIRVGVLSFDYGENGLGSMRVNPGLSSFTQDPEGAGGSLVELVQFGKKRVPKEYWGETEIRLMATAGMRMLDLGVQVRILESCRKFLRNSGFKFQDDWASVISGSNEGVYAWVAANYALGTFGGDPLNTTGIIELGGASAQLAADHGEIAYPHRRTTRGLSEHRRGLSVSKQISHSHSPRRRLTVGSAFPTRLGRVSDELPRKKRRFAVLREIRHHFARFLQLSSELRILSDSIPYPGGGNEPGRQPLGVTFVSSELIPSEFSHIVKIGNITYNLYSHSLLQFGQVKLLLKYLSSEQFGLDAANVTGTRKVDVVI